MTNDQNFHQQGMEKLFFLTSAADFRKIPGSPIAYWATDKVRECWNGKLVKDFLDIKSGLLTGNDGVFLRHWYEVSVEDVYLELRNKKLKPLMHKWIPVTSGGSFRKWYGNTYQVA